MKTLPEWIKEIETKRLEDERDAANEQRQASAEYSIMPTCLRTDYILKKKCAISDTPGAQDLSPRINQWMNLLIMTKSKDFNWRFLKR